LFIFWFNQLGNNNNNNTKSNYIAFAGSVPVSESSEGEGMNSCFYSP